MCLQINNQGFAKYTKYTDQVNPETDPGTPTQAPTNIVTNPIAYLPAGLQIQKTLKSPAGGVALIGGTVVFDVVVKNTGLSRITNWSITDNYDNTCMLLQSAVPAASTALSPPPVSWNSRPTLNPGRHLHRHPDLPGYGGQCQLPEYGRRPGHG